MVKQGPELHAYLVLGPLVLHGNSDTSWHVSQTHSGLCFVHVLRAAGQHVTRERDVE